MIGVFCKIKQSLIKDLTCVSPLDKTILIVAATDLGNVYAMSLMVQRQSSWNGLQGMALKTVCTSFLWSLSKNAHYLCSVWYWLYEKTHHHFSFLLQTGIKFCLHLLHMSHIGWGLTHLQDSRILMLLPDLWSYCSVHALNQEQCVKRGFWFGKTKWTLHHLLIYIWKSDRQWN